MKSTGEVMGVADNFGEAFAKAQISAGQKLPTQGTVFISVTDHDKPHVADLARKFVDMGFKIVATAGTADIIESAGMGVERVYKVKEGRPNVVDLIKGERIQLIVNTPQGPDPFFDEKAIRRAAVTARIPTITTVSAARAAAEGIAALQRGEVNVQALQQLHAEAGGEVGSLSVLKLLVLDLNATPGLKSSPSPKGKSDSDTDRHETVCGDASAAKAILQFLCLGLGSKFLPGGSSGFAVAEQRQINRKKEWLWRR
jgi:hypothetical protein